MHIIQTLPQHINIQQPDIQIDYLINKIIKMFQTIIQFNPQQYPFDSPQKCNNLKFETLIECKDSAQFIAQKQKYQTFKTMIGGTSYNNNNVKYHSQICIKLQQIFQQTLTIHLIFQCIPQSLQEYIKKQILLFKGENVISHKKLIIQNIASWICELTDYLSSVGILTCLEFKNMGVDWVSCNDNSGGAGHSRRVKKLKYYVGTQFQFSQYKMQELKNFYMSQRKKILKQVQKQLSLDLGKKSDYLPNYIIRGDKLIFTDDLSMSGSGEGQADQSDSKTRRKNSQSFDYHQKQTERNRYNYKESSRQNIKNDFEQNDDIFYRARNNNSNYNNANGFNHPKSARDDYRRFQNFNQNQNSTQNMNNNRHKNPPKTKQKQKKHKYSCNFEQQNLNYQFKQFNEKLNKSFEAAQNQNFLVTQTKSMKIQVQHQKPSKKCRKNSLKFKITTFEQISIDKSVDDDRQDYDNQRFNYPSYHNNANTQYNSYSNNNKRNENEDECYRDREGQDNDQNDNNKGKQEKKDYRQKVNQAKIRAQALLSKYIKKKNKK